MSQSTSSSFTAAYQHLNPEQKLAVDTIDGPVMVVAGPGTGKTQTIALRIANILLKDQVDPSNILALTYTDSGKTAMRTRLSSLIGLAAHRVQIHTFHSFCLEVIKENPSEFALDISTDPVTDLDKIQLLQRALDQNNFKLLRPLGSPYHYLSSIIRAISDLKRESVSPKQLADILDQEQRSLSEEGGASLKKVERAKREKNLAKNRELALLYSFYQQELGSTGRYDFEDMVSSVTTGLATNPDLLLDYQERLQYILVDEYQDSNTAQNNLVLLLASAWGDQANVFVTGDPDQAIMRFQGASIENQLSFIKHYPRATVITLKENYRSPQVILDAAHSLISNNHLRINDVVPNIDPHLHSQTSLKTKINLVELPNQTGELAYLASEIKSQLKHGIKPQNLAVIYRNNQDAPVIASALAKWGINYQIQGGGDILTDPTVVNFLSILQVVSELGERSDDTPLFTILHYPCFGVDPLDILKLARASSLKRTNLFEVLTSRESWENLELTNPSSLIIFAGNLTRWSALDSAETLVTTAESILNESHYLNDLLTSADSHHRLTRISSLFNLIKNLALANHSIKLRGLLSTIALMRQYHLKIEEEEHGVSDAVVLTTAHKSKGLEWDHVYLYRCLDGVWGNNKKAQLITLPEELLKNTDLSQKDHNEEERCLFYVAITRAKKNLTLTYSKAQTTAGQLKATSPTIFISELGDTHLNYQTPKLDSRTAEQDLVNMITPTRPASLDESSFLQPLVDNFTLSATALNTYLKCAYKFKLEKIIKIPQGKKPHLSFGTAIHTALESFYNKLKNDNVLPPLEYLLTTFEHALQTELLTPRDYQLWKEQGINILTAYYHHNQADFKPPLYTERYTQITLAAHTLSGKIDRIDWDDPHSKTLRVTDYKTGHSKTLGQITGETQDSTGDLERQLIFYKLLLDSDPRLQGVTMSTAILDFVESPYVRGKDGKRQLKITSDQVAVLTETINTVMSQIKSLHFPRTTELKNCVGCPFLNHCYPNGLPS